MKFDIATIWRAFTVFTRLPAYWLILLAVTGLCAFIRPFAATAEASFAFTFIYWGLIVFTTGPLGTFLIAGFQTQGWPGALRALGVCSLFSLAVFILVLGISIAAAINHLANIWLVFLIRC